MSANACMRLLFCLGFFPPYTLSLSMWPSLRRLGHFVGVITIGKKIKFLKNDK